MLDSFDVLIHILVLSTTLSLSIWVWWEMRSWGRVIQDAIDEGIRRQDDRIEKRLSRRGDAPPTVAGQDGLVQGQLMEAGKPLRRYNDGS